jgi:peptidoglycan/xylan/chitin deacetylase (PgdA/CDA1 family)
MSGEARGTGACRGRRIVVFTSLDTGPSTAEAVEALARDFPEAIFLVVRGGVVRSRSRYVRSKIRRLAREPLSYPTELVVEAVARLRPRRGRVLGGRVRPPCLEGIELANVKVRGFRDIHGEECLDAVRGFRPWLGISIGPPILREELFAIPERGTINLHKSLLPDYRGMPAAFWELHDGAPRTGVSVHWMERGVDEGAVLAQRALPVPPYASWGGVAALLDAVSPGVLREAIETIDAGREEAVPQAVPTVAARGRPPFLVARRVRRRLDRRREAAGRPGGVAGVARSAVKGAALFAYARLWAPPRNLVRALRGRCHTTILLYHRVSEEFLDSVTVGVEQFRDQMRLLARHYEVVDMRTFLASRGEPRRRPRVVVTFDDGYEDNRLAARILRREGIPCTFFLCTGIVGTEEGAFPHDLAKLERRVPPLAWSQVEEMAAEGFDFGNHTVHHVDVAAVPLEEALEEIRSASRHLVERLGRSGAEGWFAYPYGRRANMSEEVRGSLGSIGIDACFAAYGGVNFPDFDPRNISRQGIDSNFSALAFRAVVEGWRLQEGC